MYMKNEYICIKVYFQYLTRFNVGSIILRDYHSKFWTYDEFNKYDLH
jgi:hypothetical protein